MRQDSRRTTSGIADLRGSTSWLAAALALGFAFAACDGSTSSESERPFNREIKAGTTPAPDNAAVFGFEVGGVWTNNTGATLAQSTTQHSQGAASLSVRPGNNGYVALASVPLSNLAEVSPTLAVDVMLPRNQPNPYWYGTFQIYLNCPSRAIYSQFLAQVELTGKPREAWTTLNFPVNNALITSLLRAGYSDLVITLALNVPSPNAQTYYVDNLRFVPVATNGCTGRPNGTACSDGNGCTTGETCQANVCQPKSTVTCAAPDQCHTAGTCNPTTGACQYPTKADGAACDDGNACTQADTCQAGTCQGASPVVCAASDQCHIAGTCDPHTGACSNPNQVDGAACDDGDACTVGDACAAGVCTSGANECPRKCGGIAGFQCRDGEFCSFSAGTCNIVDNMGVCQPIPTVCPTLYQPVCGCDGKTYANACEADIQGMAVDHVGACERRCGTIQGLTCPAGEYCAMQEGLCLIDDAAGVCKVLPTACPDQYKPVCGCDGKTYSTECDAAAKAVNVLHQGACEQICGTLAGYTCPDHQYCSFSVGACQVTDAKGTCKSFPDACPDVYVPVCGCDGMTYGNECVAAQSGVSVLSSGVCPDPTTH